MAIKPRKDELVVTRKSRFAASVAEFWLLFRLRARGHSTSQASVMQRALRMVLVTCDHWFGKARSPGSGRDKPD